MQGTVATYDVATGAGTLLTDAGVRLAFDASTFDAHLRHLRLGQRVHVDTDDAGAITRLAIWRT